MKLGSSQSCRRQALLLSVGTTPPSSLECAVGGTRCSGKIQRDAICEGSLFLESRASQWWSRPPPAVEGGCQGRRPRLAGEKGRLNTGHTDFLQPASSCICSIGNKSNVYRMLTLHVPLNPSRYHEVCVITMPPSLQRRHRWLRH